MSCDHISGSGRDPDLGLRSCEEVGLTERVGIPPHVVPVLRDHIERFARPGLKGRVFPTPRASTCTTAACTRSSKRTKEGWTHRSPLPRPTPHRRDHGCTSRCDASRTDGSSRPLDPPGGPDLSARRRRPSSRSRSSPVKDGEQLNQSSVTGRACHVRFSRGCAPPRPRDR